MPQRIPILGAPATERQPRATPEVFGDARGLAQLGRGLEQASETTANVWDNYHRARAHRAAGEAGIALRKAAMEAAEERDPVKAGALFDAARAAARENAKSEVGDLPAGYSDLYEDLVDDDEAGVALELGVRLRKQAMEDASADYDWELARLADEESRAATPADALAIRRRARELLAGVFRLGAGHPCRGKEGGGGPTTAGAGACRVAGPEVRDGRRE